MGYQTPTLLHADLTAPATVDTRRLAWVPSPLAGVERRMIERDGGEVARATSLVRYAPGSRFEAHTHGGGEEYLVLDGVFSDENGDYGAGTYVRNPPGSSHAPFTREGCTIFVKLRQMPDHEQETIHRDAFAHPAPASGEAVRHGLFAAPHETVAVEALGPGGSLPAGSLPAGRGGEEILVLEGVLTHGGVDHPAGTWLRRPAGSEGRLSSRQGCRYWVKRGHLPGPVR